MGEPEVDPIGGWKTFTLTEDHVKLLRAAYVRWEETEWGAPAIDGKRPYGNGNIHRDIAEILGRPVLYDTDDDAAWRAPLWELHKQTETALQIVLATGSFEPGEYRCGRYHRNWEKVSARTGGEGSDG